MPFREALPASFHIQETARCQKALCVSTLAAPHVAQVRLPGGVKAIVKAWSACLGVHAVKSSRMRSSWAAYVYVYMRACVRACVLCFVGSYVPKVVWRDVFDRYPHFTPVARQKRCGGEQEICSRVSSDVRSVCTAESCLVHVHVRA